MNFIDVKMEQYAPKISAYQQRYIDLVKSDNILLELKNQNKEFLDYLAKFNEQQGNYSYGEGKWTIKEVLGHMADTERIFAYRVLRFARKDKTELSGFEQDDYVAATNFNNRTLASMINELSLIRASNILLFESFTADEHNRSGTTPDNFYTVKSLLYIIAGHEKHHWNVLLEKYAIAI